MTKRQKFSSVIGGTFEIFDCAELVQEPLHRFIRALLWYIFYKHFLPNLLLWPHYIAHILLGTPSGFTVILPP